MAVARRNGPWDVCCHASIFGKEIQFWKFQLMHIKFRSDYLKREFGGIENIKITSHG